MDYLNEAQQPNFMKHIFEHTRKRWTELLIHVHRLPPIVLDCRLPGVCKCLAKLFPFSEFGILYCKAILSTKYLEKDLS